MSFVNSYHTMEQTFDYRHELLNRQMALCAKIEESQSYCWLQGNVDMPNEHAIFYPVHDLDAFGKLAQGLGLNSLVDLKIPNPLEQLPGWIYYRSGCK